MQLTNDKLIQNFLSNLQNEGKSKVSIKNYKSDISHFLAWATLKLKSFGSYVENVSEMVPFINKKLFIEYKDYMVENGIKVKTANRRLSTLRNFSNFLFSKNIIDADFMEGIQNIGIGNSGSVQVKYQDIVDKFRESMSASGNVSANTTKNYASDVRSFLAWIEQKGELPNGL